MRQHMGWLFWLFGAAVGVVDLFLPADTTRQYVAFYGRFVVACVFLVGGVILQELERRSDG